MQESLKGSLLTYMGNTTTQDDLKEAFCRDIDAYSFEFDARSAPVGQVTPGVVPQAGPGYRDEKPAKCDVIPQSACAVGYDSHDCSGIVILVFVTFIF